MKYMKQLDTLRAFAVFGVLYHHWINYYIQPVAVFKHGVNLGAIGVDLFYVLSGFLITGILLKSKYEIDAGSETLRSSIKNFYVRRSLRILPIYYLTLFVTFIFGISPVRETIWWHICYASNFYFAQRGSWHGSVTHLWSLAVEEQFYLIWPWLILLVPRRQLFSVFIVVIAVGPLFRHGCGILNANNLVAQVVTLGNMDLFGIGGLLAYLKTSNGVNPEKTKIYLKFCLILCGLMFFESLLLRSLGVNNSLGNLSRTFEGFFFSWVINKASDGFEGVIGSIFEFKPLLYLGKISYGVYLYHMFIPSLVWSMLNALHIPVPKSISSLFLLYLTVTIVIASISWYMIEKPVAILKNKYEVLRRSKMNRDSLLVESES